MTCYGRGHGALETSANEAGFAARCERPDVPSYIAERIDSVDNIGRRLLADLAICLTAIVMMLVVLHGGESSGSSVQVNRDTDAATIKFVAASELQR